MARVKEERGIGKGRRNEAAKQGVHGGNTIEYDHETKTGTRQTGREGREC